MRKMVIAKDISLVGIPFEVLITIVMVMMMIVSSTSVEGIPLKC